MKRTDLLIGSMAGLLIFGLAVVFLIFVVSSPEDLPEVNQGAAAPLSKSNSDGSSSMQAYELVMTEAAKWRPDAQLYRVDATWPHGSTRDQLLSGSAAWTLGFYSPASGSAANFEVLGGEARLLNEFTLDATKAPEVIEQWNVDSKVAIFRLLDEGGDKFLNQKGLSTLTMSLSTNDQSDRTEWLLLLLGNQATDTLVMRLDATTGEVLETVISS